MRFNDLPGFGFMLHIIIYTRKLADYFEVNEAQIRQWKVRPLSSWKIGDAADASPKRRGSEWGTALHLTSVNGCL